MRKVNRLTLLFSGGLLHFRFARYWPLSRTYFKQILDTFGSRLVVIYSRSLESIPKLLTLLPSMAAKPRTMQLTDAICHSICL